MCGIAGFIAAGNGDEDPEASLRRMGAALRHRGPDDEGYWWNAQAGVGLAHRRLAIIDLSPAGHQPMISASGRYVIVYNGEIYNYQDLRQELQGAGVSFRGGSDTEVMLAEIERRGLAQAVPRFAGMFAFALFDLHTRTLSLIRDRLGEKPLYYGWCGRHLLFGSELKALRAHPAWATEVDRDALASYLRFSYVPAPFSIYKGIRKVPPGAIVSFSSREARAEPRITAYWSARDVVERGVAAPMDGTEDEAAERLDSLLRTIIGREMIADVPLGAFLSGGIDSSLIVALMQAQADRPVRTFTIGFHERAFNEAEYARAVARHLGTEHTELYVTPAEALAVVPRLPTLFDEPFADSSQVPTFLVSQLARQHVTVSLSGDGGDELFGGYDRYFVGDRLRRWLGPVPRVARRGLAHALRAWSPQRWDRSLVGVGLRSAFGHKVTGERLHKLANVLAGDSDRTMYRDLMTHWPDAGSVAIGAQEPETVVTDASRWAVVHDLVPWMMYVDLVGYLPDDILVKVDRATMGVSLESRAPFLDQTVVEFAWALPTEMKVRGGLGKRILRRLLHRYVPPDLVDRPKMGFGVPLDSWLRGPLKEWAASLLDPVRLRREGYLDEARVTRKWTEHQSGTSSWQYPLWDVLMFQAWLEAV